MNEGKLPVVLHFGDKDFWWQGFPTVSSPRSHFQSLLMKNDIVCDVAKSLCRHVKNTITEAWKWQKAVISK